MARGLGRVSSESCWVFIVLQDLGVRRALQRCTAGLAVLLVQPHLVELVRVQFVHFHFLDFAIGVNGR